MIIPVASIGFNRPEMQVLSIEYLSKCPEAKQTPLHMFIDNGMTREQAEGVRDRFKDAFAHIGLNYHNKRIGLSRNILGAMKSMFDKYEHTCLLEDDVLCASDFLRYHSYIQENFNLQAMKVFSVTGYAKRSVTTNRPPEELIGAVNLRTWYSPDGVVFSKDVWNMVVPYVTEAYYRDPRGFLNQFRDACKKMQPRFEKVTWLNNRHNSVLQAGLLNTLRASWGMYSIVPEISRCQDIGVYGTNHPQKVNNGENVSDERFWEKGGWYSNCFASDSNWDKLYVHTIEGLKDRRALDKKGE